MEFIKIVAFISFLVIIGCESQNPNMTITGEDEFKSMELDRALSSNDKNFEDVIYVPIYSDIYIDNVNQNSLLSATLSIRNTSFKDSLFISNIDYYNTHGDLVRSYIEQPIVLSSMATINYVIERDDATGGQGANFIVKLNSDNPQIRPLIQAIMIGENGNKGFSFSTDGYSIL